MANGSTIESNNGNNTVFGTINLTSSGGNTNLGNNGNGYNLTLAGPIIGSGGVTQNGNDSTTTFSGPAKYRQLFRNDQCQCRHVGPAE